MALVTGAGAFLLLIGRILFGGVLAYIGLSNFADTSEMAEYARSKGVPAAGFGVIASNVLLVLGGFGILLGVYPMIAAGMVAVFFLLVTPMMHDFWAVPAEQRENELAHFQKGTMLLGTALVFLVLGGEPWTYALNIGVSV